MSSHRSATIIVFAVVLIIGLGVSPRMPQSQAADSLGALSEEQLVFANRFSTFLERMNALYFNRIGKLNGDREFETKTMSTEYADYDIKVARGTVIQR